MLIMLASHPPLLSEEKVRKDNEMENYSYVVMHPN